MAIHSLNDAPSSMGPHCSLHAMQCNFEARRHYHSGRDCPSDPYQMGSTTRPTTNLYDSGRKTNEDYSTSTPSRREKAERSRAEEKQRIEAARQASDEAVIRARSTRSYDDDNSPRRSQREEISLQREKITPITTKEMNKQIAHSTASTIKQETKEAKMLGKAAYNEVSETVDMVYAPIRGALNNNDVANNALRETINPILHPTRSFVGSGVAGAATLVAAVATYNLTALKADLHDAEQRNLGKSMLLNNIVEGTVSTIHSATAFGAYASSVIKTNAYERVARQEAADQRDQQIATAHAKVESAEKRYTSQLETIKTSSEQETAKYTKNIQSLDTQIAQLQNSPAIQKINALRQEKLDNLTATYNHNKGTIEAERSKALSQIDMSTPIAAAKAREVNAHYDAKIQTLDSRHSRKVASVNSEFDTQVSHKAGANSTKLAELISTKEMLTTRHNAKLAEFANQREGAKIERDNQISLAKKEESSIRAKFHDKKIALSAEAKGRTEELSKVSSRTWKEHRMDKHDQKTAVAGIVTGVNGATRLKTAMMSQQRQLSDLMVRRLGSDEDKQIVQAYFEDKKNVGQAKKDGIRAVSALSPEDTRKAEAILKKFGYTDMSSTKDINESIKTCIALKPQLKQVAMQDTMAAKEAAKVVRSLKADRAALISAAGGKANLSVADKKKLEALDHKITAALTKQKDAQRKAQISNKAVRSLKTQIGQMIKFKEALPKMGGADRRKTRTNPKLYKQASKRISRSLGGALISLNALAGSVGKRDIMSQADAKFKSQVREVTKYTSFAANTISRSATISLKATQMVLGVGKLGTRTIKVVMGRSPLHAGVMNRLTRAAESMGITKFMAATAGGRHKLKMGVTKVGRTGMKMGGKLGRAALGAPTAILNMASMSINDIPNMVTQKMVGAMVSGGVAAVRVTGRAAVKAGVKVGRVPVKYTVKATKYAGRQVGRGVAFVGGKVGTQIGKGARFVGSKAGQGVKKAFKNTIGKTRMWDRAQQMGKKAWEGLKKAGSMVVKGAKFLAKPFKLLFQGLAKVFAWLASALSAVVGALLSIISSLVALAVYALFGLMIFLIILVMLLSVLDAIFEFFKQMGSGYQNKIQNDPSFIMNLGSNYRNVEVSILEFFSEEKGYTNNNKYKNGIEVNVNPVYYAVFNNSFEWFGLKDDAVRLFGKGDAAHKDINFKPDGTRNINEAAKNQYDVFYQNLQDNPKISNLTDRKNLLDALASMFKSMWDAIVQAFGSDSTFGDVSNIEAKDFASLVTTYDKVSAQYYYGAEGEPGTRASEYEVSNAKDALAMMDAIYTMDSEMTRCKALFYLGVGEYQLKQVEVDNKQQLAKDDVNNLFWDSHKIVYTEGVKASDIRFHTTNQYGDITPNNALGGECANYSTITVKYTEQEHEDGTCGYWDYGYWAEHEILGANAANGRNHTYEYVTFYKSGYYNGYTYLYCEDGCCSVRFYGTTYSSTDVYCWWSDMYVYGRTHDEYVYYRRCPHKEDKTDEFKYCVGHINLKAKIYVTVADPDNTGAKTLYDVAQSLQGKSGITLGNGLWTWSKDLDIHGWGSPAAESINPSEEWSDGGLQALAISKIHEIIEYQANDDDDITQMKTKHGTNTSNQYLVCRSSADSVLLHILYFKNNKFYLVDLKTGEQKDVEMRSSTASTATQKLSFKRAANGTTYPSFVADLS